MQKLIAYFANGCFGVVEKAMKLARVKSIKAFGDIVGPRSRCPANLPAKTEIPRGR
jgi:hypothetical protein